MLRTLFTIRSGIAYYCWGHSLQELLSEIEILILTKDTSAETRFKAILKKIKAAERVLRTLSETSFDGFLIKKPRHDEKKTTA